MVHKLHLGTHTCNIDLPQLPLKERHGHIIPGLASHSLLSVLKLCDAGCDVLFNKIGCSISYQGKEILCAHKFTRTSIWVVPIITNHHTPTTVITSEQALLHQFALNFVEMSTQPELAQYHQNHYNLHPSLQL